MSRNARVGSSWLVLALTACAGCARLLGPTVPPVAAAPEPVELKGSFFPLPGAEGPAFLDLIAFEAEPPRVWVPVGRTGSVDVFDIASSTFTRVDGFQTKERVRGEQKRTLGPSAAAVGAGVVYVGNRATHEVCAVDEKSLTLGKCLALPADIDCVAYVPAAREVWVTLPDERTLAVLDASEPAELRPKTTLRTDGAPEGFATDDARGLFFTNLEDKGDTLVFDVKTHQVTATWNAQCGPDGPRGLVFDRAHNFVIVGCTDHLQVLDAGHGGALLGRLDTGAGIDFIDVVDGKVYAAAGRAAKLTVARVGADGSLTVIATGATSTGARNAVADSRGNTYVADSPGARLIVFPAPARP